MARWLSVPGRVKLVACRVPSVWAAAVTPTSATIHATTVIRRWRMVHAASRARTPEGVVAMAGAAVFILILTNLLDFKYFEKRCSYSTQIAMKNGNDKHPVKTLDEEAVELATLLAGVVHAGKKRSGEPARELKEAAERQGLGARHAPGL